MKCIVCGAKVGLDPRDSTAQGHCWKHVTAEPYEPEMVVMCRIDGCHNPAIMKYEDFCERHWANILSWMPSYADKV